MLLGLRRVSEIVSANDDIIELVQSHADGDDKKFYTIAMQIAAKAARLGHTQFAQELRDLVTELRQDRKSTRLNSSHW